ncbi:hypothetical protein QMU90_003550 [Edwardsiella ictaluri]|nr:hypothetical protein [Edwardsiella ictaluri]
MAVIIIYFKNGYVLYDWRESIFASLKKGVIVGLILGLGLWFKEKLQERKDRKKSNH